MGRFALLVIPNHQDPEDAQACPFALNNEQPMSWQWLNTVNRVNTQVKKVRRAALGDVTAMLMPLPWL